MPEGVGELDPIWSCMTSRSSCLALLRHSQYLRMIKCIVTGRYGGVQLGGLFSKGKISAVTCDWGYIKIFGVKLGSCFFCLSL